MGTTPLSPPVYFRQTREGNITGQYVYLIAEDAFIDVRDYVVGRTGARYRFTYPELTGDGAVLFRTSDSPTP